jgi:hypothetical protein
VKKIWPALLLSASGCTCTKSPPPVATGDVAAVVTAVYIDEIVEAS